MTVTINTPTRVIESTATIIDQIITNMPDEFYYTNVINSLLSDHYAKCTTINMIVPQQTVELLNSTNLEIQNQGNDPTFCNSRRLEVTDITLGSLGLSESIKSCEVSSEPSLSDHKTYSVQIGRLSTGTPVQRSRRYQVGLLSRGFEGQAGAGTKNEHERRGRTGADNLLCQPRPNLDL